MAAMVGIWISWLFAWVFSEVRTHNSNSPFDHVWLSFTASGSARILACLTLGLAVTCALPSRGPALSKRLVEGRRKFGPRGWLLLACTSIGLSLLVKGSYIWRAPNYLAFDAPDSLISLSNVLAPAGALACGALVASRRGLGAVACLSFLLIQFAYGGRLMALAPLIFVLGFQLDKQRFNRATLGCAAALTLVAMPIPLRLRELSIHGLMPYLTYLGEEPFEAYRLHSQNILGNIGFTAAVAEHVANRPSITSDALRESVAPLWFGGGGWDAVQPQLMVHFFIPYSAIGEWANVGLAAVVGLGVVWGLFARTSFWIAFAYNDRLFSLGQYVVVGLVSISCLYMFQYNTRAVARIVSVCLPLMILLWFLAVTRRREA